MTKKDATTDTAKVCSMRAEERLNVDATNCGELSPSELDALIAHDDDDWDDED